MEQTGEQVHALDLGCGCGSLALLAARAGADSVTGVEAHPALVTVARRNAALNGLSSKVGWERELLGQQWQRMRLIRGVQESKPQHFPHGINVTSIIIQNLLSTA
eukprot:scaffold24235_cov19-Tisochrysis_lutea.AAC.1